MVSLASTNRAPGIVAPSVGSSLKRKQTDSSSDNEGQLSVQMKRRRVTFDPEVDIRILADPNEKSQELVDEEVVRALEKHAAGDASAYDLLRSYFSERPTAHGAPLSSLLQKYLIALTNNVPSLDHSRRGLVHTIVDCHWIARNEHFVRTYRLFIRSLLSVHPAFTSTVLGMLVNMFVEPPSPNMRQGDDPAMPRIRLLSRAHDTLRSILRQNPMASTHLGTALASTFPFPTDTSKAHTLYIDHILQVSEYCPELKGTILSLIMDKLVKIDVQIQVDMEELDDELEDQLIEESARGLDDEDYESDNESVSSEESLDGEERRLKEIKDSVLKLDNIMFLLFSHYDAIFAKGDRFDNEDIYECLLSQFASIILPTYRSRHTQFLLFHFSQRSPDFIDGFAGCCSQLAFDPTRPQILRVAAAAYLASFIARGAHVPRSTVRDVFDLLGHHLETLRQQQEPSCKGPDKRRYGTYYAISQALLYAFCFRWRDLIVTPDDLPLTDEDIIYHEGDFTWYGSIKDTLHRNIFSKLNPLKICSPMIVQQFARIAHHLRFIYVSSLIETNKRVRLARTTGGYPDGVGARETALTMKKGEDGFLLDAYFPFDPYVLPRSKKWIEGDYVEWKPIPGMVVEGNDDDDDEDDDESDDDDVDDDESTVDLPVTGVSAHDLDVETDSSSN